MKKIESHDLDQASDYADLVSLFKEFREFIKPNINNGVPDYLEAVMEEQRQGLKKFQDSLSSMDISSLPVSQQIDYHVVRAEINGVDFDHRVIRPWARDPGFYHILHATRMYGWPIQVPKAPLLADAFPLKADEIAEFQMKLQAIPKRARDQGLRSLS